MVCLYCYININDINIEGVIFGVFLNYFFFGSYHWRN